MSRSEELIKKTEGWLEKPIASSISEAISTSSQLLSALQDEIQKEGADKKRIGLLIGKVKGVEKSLRSLEEINWMPVSDGFLAIGHRPGSKLMIDLRLQNATHLLTLLSKSEGGKEIEKAALSNDLKWLWLPMESAEPLPEARYKEVAILFTQMKAILTEGGRIYIHCSAGIHRTGMITYAFLRFLGEEENATKSKLGKLRSTTSNQVGEHRLKWGNTIFRKLQDCIN